MQLKKNLSRLDRGIRIALGAALIVVYFTHLLAGVWGILLLPRASVFLTTAVLAFCPFYKVFNISTLKPKLAKN